MNPSLLNPSVARRAGIVGMFGAALWLLTLILEYSLGLYPPDGEGPLYVLNQLLALLALAGIAYGWLGHRWGGGVSTRFGSISVWMFAVGYALIIVAGLVALLLRSDDSPIFLLFPLGGLLMDLGALFTGIAVVRAGNWSGWQRFMPLVYALYLWLAIEIPSIAELYADGPGFVPEIGQALGLFLVGLAVFSAHQASKQTGNVI